MGLSRRIRIALCSVVCFYHSASAAPAGTTVTLTASSAGSVITSGQTITSGTPVTLKAVVTSGSTQVTRGQVNFCDASVTYCTDIHLIGTAQLTSAGNAVLSFTPGNGSRSYKAVFLGTPRGTTPYAGSTSSSATFTVSGSVPTATSIAQDSGSGGSYVVNAIVGSAGSAAATGTVSVMNASDSNAVLGTGTLQPGSGGFTFVYPGDLDLSSIAPDDYTINAVGDFNGDGKLDFVVVNSGGCVSAACTKDASLTALLGDGKGGFTPAATLDLSPPSGAAAFDQIVVADFDGDGSLDLAIGKSVTNTTTIVLGRGDGTFATKATVNVYGPMFVGDFNSDGIPDLAVNEQKLTILFGDGSGQFTFSTAPPLALMPVGVGDFNNDGRADIAAVDSNGSLSALLGNGDGTFSASPATVAVGTSISVTTGDFDEDGKLDIAVGDYVSGKLTISLGQGDGTFKQGAVVADAATAGPDLAGDFNGDGNVDIVISGGKLLLGKGDGTFTAQPATAWPYPTGFQITAAGDFNSDGTTDLVAYGIRIVFAAPQSATASTSIVLPAGSGIDSVFASYAGDSSNDASTSGLLKLQAGQATATVTVTPSQSSVPFGSSVTLTAKIDNKGAVPTGNITFYDGSAQLGGAVSLDGTGQATYATSSLAVGTHAITAWYGGDPNYTAAHSTSSSVDVTATPAGITVPGPPAVSPGGTATATATISAGSSYSGTMNLTCALTASPTGAQSVPACSMKPTSVTLSAGGSASATLSVTTTAASTVSFAAPSRNSLWGLGGGMLLSVVWLWGVPGRRRTWMVRMLGLVCLATAVGMVGCGGSKSSSPAPSGTPATTAGNYTFTITGTDSAKASTTISTTVVVTVN